MFRKLTRHFIIFFLAFIAIASLFNAFSQSAAVEQASIPALIQYVNKDEVTSIDIHRDKLTVALKDGKKVEVLKESGESLSDLLKNYGATTDKIAAVQIAVKGDSTFQVWAGAILPFLVPFIIVAFFLWVMMRQVQGANMRAMSFGQSGARQTNPDAKNRVTFNDVAGVAEAKEELMEVVEFLKNPKKFTSIGAKIPKGVLLLGHPGVGKTLLARAVAGEANVPFLHISGSEFVEMFVGVGASRVRDLFTRAKKNNPCIVFIDELDAVGRQRGTGLGGSHDEREQTLNQILVEMDGFDPTVGIIVLAATNRADVLDPALLRPGRFDRRVIIDPPDLKAREAILAIHARNKPLASDTDIHRIAVRTPGFTGADLANLLNEAAILAARRNKKEVEMIELLESIEKVMLGPERKSHLLSMEERKVTAYHEAGHAIVAHILPHADPVHKISIISRGRAAGYTIKLPTEDRQMKTKSAFLDELAVLLGGQTAERMAMGDITTGPSNDLREATRVARRLITEYGMSELGPRTFGEKEEMVFLGRDFAEQRDYSEKMAERIDAEITKLVFKAQKQAETILKKNRKIMDKIVVALLEKETLEKEEFEAFFSTTGAPKNSNRPDSARPTPPSSGTPVESEIPTPKTPTRKFSSAAPMPA
ncbi:ATP-dependent zinc metalloprotease FtsH [Candidatus Uhrbacteria bacterium]|nr:ATP-dependent zinc metalloprotease FtsH [Candidatus Uhrbacteria bacterium]